MMNQSISPSVHQFVLAPTWSTAKLIAWHRDALAIVWMVLSGIVMLHKWKGKTVFLL